VTPAPSSVHADPLHLKLPRRNIIDQTYRKRTDACIAYIDSDVRYNKSRPSKDGKAREISSVGYRAVEPQWRSVNNASNRTNTYINTHTKIKTTLETQGGNIYIDYIRVHL